MLATLANIMKTESFQASHHRRLRRTLEVCGSIALLTIVLGPMASAQDGSNTRADLRRTDLGAAAPALPIGSGDLLDVRIFDTPELSGQLRVNEQGEVLVPVAGLVPVSNLTPAEAAHSIEVVLQERGIMLHPNVTVLVAEYATQGITVTGEVKLPGIYSLLGRHSLYDVLSAAGGSTPSEGPTITITRRTDPSHPVTLQVQSPNYQAVLNNTTVDPGDTIVVSRAGVIYVVGDVARPGGYVIQNGAPLTVLNTLALASGPNQTAALKKARIVRKTNQGLVIIDLNLKDVMNYKEANIAMQDGDILVIPGSVTKDILIHQLPGVSTGVAVAATSALIYQ
jgi:polysaccharide biosynthesis/export protein